MAKSKFDESLLKPIEEQNQNSSGWNPSLLTPIEEESEEEFLQPKQESVLGKLPRNILIGLAKLGHRTINLPYETAKDVQRLSEPFGELQKKYLPALQGTQKQTGYLEKMVNQFNQEHNVPEELKNPNWGFNVENIPHQKEQNYAEMLGQQGRGTLLDRLLQGGLEYAPDIAMLTKLASSGTKSLLPGVGEKVSNIKNYKKLQEQLAKMENKGEIAGEKANEANLLAEQAKEEAQALKEPKEISEYLNKGATYRSKMASSINHRLGNIEKYWSDAYKDLKTNLKDSHFQMEDMPSFEPDIDFILKNIKEAKYIPSKTKGGRGTLQFKEPERSTEFKEIMKKVPTSKDTNASDFLTKYQDFRDARYDLLQRAKTSDTASKRQELFKVYEDTKPIEEKVLKALHEGLGEYSPEFARINKGYSEQIYPLRKNKVAQQAKEGKVGVNVLEDLVGNDEGSQLMREIVKQDPELLRDLLGQRYAKKPSQLHEMDQNTADYLAEMPEFQKMLDLNLEQYNKKLEEINKHKEQKKISLKEKLNSENEAKELKNKIRIINKDRLKIRKALKRTGKVLGYGALGIAGIKSIQQLLK